MPQNIQARFVRHFENCELMPCRNCSNEDMFVCGLGKIIQQWDENTSVWRRLLRFFWLKHDGLVKRMAESGNDRSASTQELGPVVGDGVHSYSASEDILLSTQVSNTGQDDSWATSYTDTNDMERREESLLLQALRNQSEYAKLVAAEVDITTSQTAVPTQVSVSLAEEELSSQGYSSATRSSRRARTPSRKSRESEEVIESDHRRIKRRRGMGQGRGREK